MVYCSKQFTHFSQETMFFFRRDEGAASCFRFSRFVFCFFQAAYSPYGSSQDLYRILIIMHQKMRLKILRAMA